jgi:hypothetical protein
VGRDLAFPLSVDLHVKHARENLKKAFFCSFWWIEEVMVAFAQVFLSIIR